MSCSDAPERPAAADPLIGSLPYREGHRIAESRRATEIRARRNATVARSTTRFGDDRFPHSPFWLVAIGWDNERCATCARPLPEETQAAFDEDEQACFCFTCAYKWLDERDDEPEPPPPHPTVTRRDAQLQLDV